MCVCRLFKIFSFIMPLVFCTKGVFSGISLFVTLEDYFALYTSYRIFSSQRNNVHIQNSKDFCFQTSRNEVCFLICLEHKCKCSMFEIEKINDRLLFGQKIYNYLVVLEEYVLIILFQFRQIIKKKKTRTLRERTL